VRRLVGGVVAAALVFGVVGIRVLDPAPAPAARREPDVVRARPAPARPDRVSLFGDSLIYQARAAFEVRMRRDAPGDLEVSGRPGAALCDDRDAIAADLLVRRPEVLVLEYSGNSYTACMRGLDGQLLVVGSRAWRAKYVDDLHAVLTVADLTGAQIIWASAPPVRHAPDPVDYPRRSASAVRTVAADHPNLSVVDTGDALASADHGYSRALPCRADELLLCDDGRITVRADDGLHFDCHGLMDPLGECLGYSAGARRFGEAIAAAVIDAGRGQAGRTNRGPANAVLSTMTSTNVLGSTSSRYTSSAAR
jgi:hypothetical protein